MVRCLLQELTVGKSWWHSVHSTSRVVSSRFDLFHLSSIARMMELTSLRCTPSAKKSLYSTRCWYKREVCILEYPAIWLSVGVVFSVVVRYSVSNIPAKLLARVWVSGSCILRDSVSELCNTGIDTDVSWRETRVTDGGVRSIGVINEGGSNTWVGLGSLFENKLPASLAITTQLIIFLNHIRNRG